jgi:hypothetical protein
MDKGKRAASTIKNENIRMAELNMKKESKLLDERANRMRLTFFIAHINRLPIFVYLRISIRTNTSI